MATITIKNLPKGVHRQLRTSAERHHRSLNSEVIFCLENALRRSVVDPGAVLQEARASRKMTRRFRLTDQTLRRVRAQGRA